MELFEGVKRGEIKALWIACTNPAQSMPHQAAIREALAAAAFVVLQDAFRTTETAEFADLILPASTWGEKEGTATNSERRITHVRRAVPPPGEARPDWQIARDFALRLGHALGDTRAARLFPYFHPEQVFREHAETTRGRDLDIAELDYAVLDEQGPQQWPWSREAGGKSRLYGDGRFPTASGKAHFVRIDARVLAENTDARHPLHLNSGRLRDQWHGMSRTGKAARLFNHAGEACLSMHADDMARRSLADGDLARVRSRRGEIVVRVAASPEMRPGQTFLPMHFGRRHLSNAGVNELMAPAVDPYSRQPEMKHAAVQVEKASLPFQALAMRTAVGEAYAQERALAWLTRLQPLLARFDYASLALAGRDQPAVVLRIAHGESLPAEWDAEIDALLDLPAAECLAYRDARRNIDKKALIVEGKLAGLRLTGETAAGDWLRETMVEGMPADELRRWIFAPLAAPPVATTARGRIVCNCLNVAEADIVSAIAGGATLELLQAGLKCGTSCGSCVPEIKRMLATRVKAA